MDLAARIREMGQAGQPVGIVLTETDSGWVAVCSDGSVFAFSKGVGKDGDWIECIPVPGTPAASAKGE